MSQMLTNAIDYYIKTLQRKLNTEPNPLVKEIIEKDIREAQDYKKQLKK